MKNEALEILSITLEKGSVLPQHTSPRDAFLIVLEGALEFLINGKTYSLKQFEDFSFPKEVTHQVVAREDSRFMIIR
jgi:quercetin dioxygenase-like cupin family protein